MVQSPSEPSTFIGEDVELVWQHYGLTSDERWWANRALLLDPRDGTTCYRALAAEIRAQGVTPAA